MSLLQHDTPAHHQGQFVALLPARHARLSPKKTRSWQHNAPDCSAIRETNHGNSLSSARRGLSTQHNTTQHARPSAGTLRVAPVSTPRSPRSPRPPRPPVIRGTSRRPVHATRPSVIRRTSRRSCQHDAPECHQGHSVSLLSAQHAQLSSGALRVASARTTGELPPGARVNATRPTVTRDTSCGHRHQSRLSFLSARHAHLSSGTLCVGCHQGSTTRHGKLSLSRTTRLPVIRALRVALSARHARLPPGTLRVGPASAMRRLLLSARRHPSCQGDLVLLACQHGTPACHQGTSCRSCQHGAPLLARATRPTVTRARFVSLLSAQRTCLSPKKTCSCQHGTPTCHREHFVPLSSARHARCQHTTPACHQRRLARLSSVNATPPAVGEAHSCQHATKEDALLLARHARLSSGALRVAPVSTTRLSVIKGGRLAPVSTICPTVAGEGHFVSLLSTRLLACHPGHFASLFSARQARLSSGACLLACLPACRGNSLLSRHPLSREACFCQDDTSNRHPALRVAPVSTTRLPGAKEDSLLAARRAHLASGALRAAPAGTTRPAVIKGTPVSTTCQTVIIEGSLLPTRRTRLPSGHLVSLLLAQHARLLSRDTSCRSCQHNTPDRHVSTTPIRALRVALVSTTRPPVIGDLRVAPVNTTRPPVTRDASCRPCQPDAPARHQRRPTLGSTTRPTVIKRDSLLLARHAHLLPRALCVAPVSTTRSTVTRALRVPPVPHARRRPVSEVSDVSTVSTVSVVSAAFQLDTPNCHHGSLLLSAQRSCQDDTPGCHQGGGRFVGPFGTTRPPVIKSSSCRSCQHDRPACRQRSLPPVSPVSATRPAVTRGTACRSCQHDTPGCHQGRFVSLLSAQHARLSSRTLRVALVSTAHLPPRKTRSCQHDTPTVTRHFVSPLLARHPDRRSSGHFAQLLSARQQEDSLLSAGARPAVISALPVDKHRGNSLLSARLLPPRKTRSCQHDTPDCHQGSWRRHGITTCPPRALRVAPASRGASWTLPGRNMPRGPLLSARCTRLSPRALRVAPVSTTRPTVIRGAARRSCWHHPTVIKGAPCRSCQHEAPDCQHNAPDCRETVVRAPTYHQGPTSRDLRLSAGRARASPRGLLMSAGHANLSSGALHATRASTRCMNVTK